MTTTHDAAIVAAQAIESAIATVADDDVPSYAVTARVRNLDIDGHDTGIPQVHLVFPPGAFPALHAIAAVLRAADDVTTAVDRLRAATLRRPTGTG